jgi:hypothetical protein
VIVVPAAALDYRDKDKIVGRIDPEPRAGRAIQKKVPLSSGMFASGGSKTTAQLNP